MTSPPREAAWQRTVAGLQAEVGNSFQQQLHYLKLSHQQQSELSSDLMCCNSLILVEDVGLIKMKIQSLKLDVQEGKSNLKTSVCILS